MEAIIGKHSGGGTGEGAHWLSVSDLMAGLMMVFLFVSIALMRDATIERDRIRDVAVAYQDTQVAIFQALMEEFRADLTRWDAQIDRDTLAFEFQAPEVLFGVGDKDVRPRFQHILAEFFPRYLAILKNYKDSIDEVRIEGHTSSIWNHRVSENEAYFNNMKLSQGRTRSVLRYVYQLPAASPARAWVKRHFAAVGFSSARPVLDNDGKEDRSRSRRVTFRVMTNAETQIRKIIEK